ncbi:hypothetical protein B1222_13980 [Paenibacillus larvae subsp. pulvifaciens]|uniref:PIN domain-containing protein n=1 Tax=Paenibacillus larvae TaxID=1464 RepID=UPI00098E9EC7|nr:hypothetical protein B1222_13980 [Paenibacillus larvae subsp. pulvifaciens]AQZ47262.1 hypothetical protein B5S25_12365 [Paenibacillus larvae subsp. pulvifaciens]
MGGLLTSNVFIDSSTYINRNFSFKDHLLGYLGKLAINNHIRLFTSEIVLNEVENKIDERCKEAKLALDSLRKKGMILRHIRVCQDLCVNFFKSISPRGKSCF